MHNCKKRSFVYHIINALIVLILTSLCTICTQDVSFAAQTCIKNLVHFESVRENTLMGQGMITGLSGTGDDVKTSVMTSQILAHTVKGFGANMSSSDPKQTQAMNTKNVAYVLVMGNLKPFARRGSTFTVSISALAGATSLQGGILMPTALKGADGKVYAVAKGPITIGSYVRDDKRNKVTQITTTGYIQDGAVVENEIPFTFNSLKEMKLGLKNPDFTTARAITTAINSYLRADIAVAMDPGTVNVKIPEEYQSSVVNFISDIENLPVVPNSIAKIIIDQASGTIVIGEDVKISQVAVSQNNLNVIISDEEKLLNPDRRTPPEPGTRFATMAPNATLNDLVQGLNSLGVKPQELTAILQAIQQAGALQATIEIR